jgi:NRAMP (natural resistance-associated macrophage protein)-like metal ion transporter
MADDIDGRTAPVAPPNRPGTVKAPVAGWAADAGASLAGTTLSPARSRALTARRVMGLLGPGIVTGAADDDPSGIATYSQTGAEFGYGQLWTALWMLPLLAAVQEACGRIGNVTGQGLAALIKSRYNLVALRMLVTLLLVANIINIGADIGAVAASVHLVVPLPSAALAVLFTAVLFTVEVWFSYRRYARVLKWLTLALLTYPVTAFLVHEPWARIARATFVPHVELSASFFYVLTALIGTTISPYMFFWQTSQEVEERRSPRGARSLRDVRLDNAIGMLNSQLIAWFIIVLTSTVLHGSGVTTVNSAADAARALRPLVKTFPHSGEIAQGLFAFGITALGMLAVPVMAGSAAYAVSEARGWPEGLDLKPGQGRRFYGIIGAAMLIGLVLNVLDVNPVAALVFAAVVNAVVSVPLLWVILRISSDHTIMGQARSGWISRTVLGLALVGVAASAVMAVVPHLS